MSNIEYLRPYIEGTIDSSARFRRVLIVLIITSVLVFVGFWNARKGSWLNSRIRLANVAEDYLTLEEINQALASFNPSSAVAKDESPNITQQALLRRRADLSQKLANTDVESAKVWIDLGGFRTSAQIRSYSENLQKARTEHVVFLHVPFFGTVLDVNELGLIGGFSLVVVLMWFRFTLWRESYNLTSTFEVAKDDSDLEYCYRYLAMNQVLTVPPILSQTQPYDRPWGKVVRYLYLLPVAVQAAVFVNDCLTFDLGWVVSKFNTIVSITASFCFLFISALLTYWCLRLSADIDRSWESVAERVRNFKRTNSQTQHLSAAEKTSKRRQSGLVLTARAANDRSHQS